MCTPARYNVGLAVPPDGDLNNINCTELPVDGREEDRCRHITFDYTLTTSIICGLSLVFGILYSLFGYRCFKAVMFLTGFTFGSVVVYLICMEEEVLPPLGNAGVSLGAGVLFGAITMLVQYVGLFMTGFHTGLYCGVITLVVLDFFYRLATIWLSLAILMGWGLVFALANLRLQKSLTIFGTSVHGGAVIMVSMDYFIEEFRAARWALNKVRLKEEEWPCWFSWVILGLWPLLALIGVLVQARITGKGTHHKVTAPHHKTRTVNLQRLRSRQARAELRQRKYRYLYQVRTAHGDIISQEYVHSLNSKMSQPGDQSTLQSDCTRITSVNDQAALTALSESEHEAEVLNPTDSPPTAQINGGVRRRESDYGDRVL